MNFEQFKEAVTKDVRKDFFQNNELLPIIYLGQTGSEGLLKVPPPVNCLGSPQRKRAFAMELQVIAKSMNCELFAFGSEAWLSTYETESDNIFNALDYAKSKPLPSEDPNRKEVILLSFEFKKLNEGTHQSTCLNIGIDSSKPLERRLFELGEMKTAMGVFLNILA